MNPSTENSRWSLKRRPQVGPGQQEQRENEHRQESEGMRSSKGGMREILFCPTKSSAEETHGGADESSDGQLGAFRHKCAQWCWRMCIAFRIVENSTGIYVSTTSSVASRQMHIRMFKYLAQVRLAKYHVCRDRSTRVSWLCM